MPADRLSYDNMNFDSLANIADRDARALQPWPSYYRLRAKEMKALFSIYKPSSRGRALDIGSGMGFNALMLDRLYGSTVAADLYSKDASTHSLGMGLAREFLGKVRARNIDLVSARCEGLPFVDGSFDTVYLIYTLEHVKDRVEALNEARRVLKPGGEVVVIVPGFVERLLYPISYYRDIIVKAVRHIVKSKARPDETGPRPAPGRVATSFFSAYPHFPFPDPHGEYADYFCELAMSPSFVWRAYMKKSGLKVKNAFTTMLFPKQFLSLFVGEKALDLYIKTLWLNEKFGRNIFFRNLGQNLCFILEKNG